MHVHLEAGHEDALLHPLKHVAGHDRGQDEAGVRERKPGRRQSDQPGPPPERRMHQIDGVVVEIAEARRMQRHTRQFAVDRIEKGHAPGCDEPQREMTVPEQPHRGQHQHQAGRRHLIRRDSGLGAELGHVARRARPGVQRDQIGHALVGTAERALFDGRQGFGCERQQKSRFALAQLVVVVVGDLVDRDDARCRRCARFREHGLGRGGVLRGNAEGDDLPVVGLQRHIVGCARQTAHQRFVVDPVGAQQHDTLGAGLQAVDSGASELPLQPGFGAESPDAQRRSADDDPCDATTRHVGVLRFWHDRNVSFKETAGDYR